MMRLTGCWLFVQRHDKCVFLCDVHVVKDNHILYKLVPYYLLFNLTKQ